MRRRLLRLAVAALALPLLVAACGDDDDAGDGSAIRVLASNSIVADWVKQVGGDLVDVRPVIPAGADLHTFQLTPGDVTSIGDADIVILVGAGLESSFEDAVRGNASGPVVELTEGLTLLEPARVNEEHEPAEGEEEHEEDDHGPLDPHVWMDIRLVTQIVDRLGNDLATVDPENAGTYERRAADYGAELQALDEELAAMLDGLPEQQKFLVTFHDAYAYLAARYGLAILGFVVESADEEPSAQRVADLITEMRERGARVIYVEPQFDSRAIEQIAEDTGAEIRTLPSDSLDDDYPTYVEFMRTIAETIAR